MSVSQNSNEKVLDQKNSVEKQSRGEKRTLKNLEIFNFKKISDITKVKIEKKKQIWILNNPEVFQSQRYNSLLIFGEAKIGRETSN